MDYIIKNHARDTNEEIQSTTLSALEVLIHRPDFDSVNENKIKTLLPLLFENLKRTEVFSELWHSTISLMKVIEHCVPKFKLAIYRALFANNIDPYTEKKLKVYTVYNDIIKWIGATIRITHFRAKNFSVN